MILSLFIMAEGYSGTSLPMPDWCSNALRVLNFGMAMFLLALWTAQLLDRERPMPGQMRKWGVVALMLFTVRLIVGQIERWNTAYTLEGGVLGSLALIAAIVGVLRYEVRRRKHTLEEVSVSRSLTLAEHDTDEDGRRDLR